MKEFLSHGLYSVREASRILHLKPPTVRRWAFGYRRRGKEYEPVTPRIVPDLDGRHALTYLELVQLLTVRDFLKAGSSWALVRHTYDVARERLGTPFPFARDRWFADPAGIYHREDPAGDVLTEMSTGGVQTAMEEALAGYLREMDFDDGHSLRWYPLGRMKPVVLDPDVSFGAPVVEGTGVRTETLDAMRRAGEDIDSVAWWYGLEPHQVDAAVEYERSLAA